MSTNSIKKQAIAGVLALSTGMIAANVMAVPSSPTAWEKCSGISKAGMNDCGALDGKHSCASQAASNNMKSEWVYVPQGTCSKITGGVVAAVKPAK